ncbi:MAG: NAD-dependent protein deacylase [Isosphaeraceae bacterium]
MTSCQIVRSETAPALSPDDERGVDRIVQAMSRARRLLFITGAGMSADSGLPTYRGRDGIYRAQQTTLHGLTIEQALSGPMLRARPEITWHYLLELEKTSRHAVPNRGHHVIAEMDGYFDAVWVLTQNVDGLHQRAGSRNVLDVHGSLSALECMRCGQQTTTRDYSTLTLPPRCSECEGPIRPQVVLFEEELPYDKFSRLWYEFGAGFDLIFSIGTSSMFEYIVEPVRVGRQMGITTVEINPETTTISSEVDIKIGAGAATVLASIWERYLAWWPWA